MLGHDVSLVVSGLGLGSLERPLHVLGKPCCACWDHGAEHATPTPSLFPNKETPSFTHALGARLHFKQLSVRSQGLPNISQGYGASRPASLGTPVQAERSDTPASSTPHAALGLANGIVARCLVPLRGPITACARYEHLGARRGNITESSHHTITIVARLGV
jgi:hypothetical protein